MGRLLQPLLLHLSVATDRELARMVQFLKEENRILRGQLPDRITVTPKERQRLLKYGRGLGTAIRDLISIVSPRTFARWLSGETVRKKRPSRKPGRPKTAVEIRDLVLRIARDNDWGYTRILGELKKLGIAVSRSTVVAILKENGLDPGPKHGEGTCNDFIKPFGNAVGLRFLHQESLDEVRVDRCFLALLHPCGHTAGSLHRLDPEFRRSVGGSTSP